MISKWENYYNKKLVISERGYMDINDIFNKMDKKERTFKLNPLFKTIRYIDKDEYFREIYKYVEPTFYEEDLKNIENPKFILISAPGATGKSALAKHICYKYNGIYWNLPDSKVAEYSFQGAIQNAVGPENLSDFYKSLNGGNDFLVIDAFDEAETGSGRTGIEFFLRDINTVTINNNNLCAVLLARTESALFIKKYFNENNISYNHYEVGYFEENNAKTYIKNSLEKKKISINKTVDDCINAQFTEIKRILMNKNTDSFIGYAPVLNALAESYDNERNTLNLLKNTHNSESNCELLKKIIDCLLEREQKKFVDSLKIKMPNIDVSNNKIYDKKEQLLRIFGKIVYNDSELFITDRNNIPLSDYETYSEAINIQLPQHPFIKFSENSNNFNYSFTGIAFSDYILAYALSIEDIKDYVREYISDNKYCPSPLLIEFYSILSNNCISGKDISIMYNSFKAHAQTGDKTYIYINGDKSDCYIEFILENKENKRTILNFFINDADKGIYMNQMSNCYIDIDADVYIGDTSSESRISNSTINCNNIYWQCENISIEAYNPGECALICNNMEYKTSTFPKIEIKTDDENRLIVSCNNLKGYYKLLHYQKNLDRAEDTDDFNSFSNLIRRIFSCLRSHSKDAPARKMDFINNRIINKNIRKENILKFLLDMGILYTDEQDWLYKLKTDKLSTYSINWNAVRDGNFESLKDIYDIYNK